ncbi:MAG: undecaprenyl-diphosphate phosphatase [Verrucomicrobiota bacterium]
MDTHSLVVASLLGLIEGLTEFIPVSSTGHLLIAEHWLPRQSDLFNVVIQSGAVLAVLPLFRHHLRTLREWRKRENLTLILQIAVAFLITGIGGLLLEKLHFRLPESPIPVAWALIVGGILFLLVESKLKTRSLSPTHSWLSTVLIGFAQLIAAIFPGASRSGTTILTSMATGTQRVTATEFSFLVGIPTLLAAGALKIFKALKHGATEDWSMVSVATIVAAIVSFVTVKWLLRFVQSHSFISFGIYRIIAGLFLLFVL